MKNWNYEELVNEINESYKLGLEQGRDKLQSIGCVSEDYFFYPEDENLVENLISLIETIKLCIEHLNYVFNTTIEIFQKQKSLINKEFLSSELTSDEVEKLNSDIIQIDKKLKTLQVK
nr:Imm3 family immunity protein [uncultured Allomuricauda sp.]